MNIDEIRAALEEIQEDLCNFFTRGAREKLVEVLESLDDDEKPCDGDSDCDYDVCECDEPVVDLLDEFSEEDVDKIGLGVLLLTNAGFAVTLDKGV